MVVIGQMSFSPYPQTKSQIELLAIAVRDRKNSSEKVVAKSGSVFENNFRTVRVPIPNAHLHARHPKSQAYSESWIE